MYTQSLVGHRIACRFELYDVLSSSGMLTRRAWYWCGGVVLALFGSTVAADECSRYRDSIDALIAVPAHDAPAIRGAADTAGRRAQAIDLETDSRFVMVLKLERALSAADTTSKATTEAFNALGPLPVGEDAKGLDVARKAVHAALNARHKAAISAHEVMFVALCGEWTTNP